MLPFAIQGQYDAANMEIIGRAVRALACALWVGGGLAMLLATRALFDVAPTRKEAGHYSGAVLRRFRTLQIWAAALTALSALFGARTAQTGLAGLAALLFVASLPLDARLRALRTELGGSTEGIDLDDPRRKRFGALHGVSVLLLLAQIASAGLALTWGALANR